MEMSSIGRNICTQVLSGFQSFWASLTLTEISGAFGDVGTFVPLLVRHPINCTSSKFVLQHLCSNDLFILLHCLTSCALVSYVSPA